MTKPFDLILQKHFQEAYDLATMELETMPSSRNKLASLRHRAMAAMLMKQYDKALIDYLAVIEMEEKRYSSDTDYLNAAICFWLMREHQQAVDLCKVGLNAPKYTLPNYSSNFAKAPAFLYFAAIKLKDKKLEKLALRIMKKDKTRFNNPISQFLLGHCSPQEYEDTLEIDSPLYPREMCIVEFYLAVDCLRNNDRHGYISHLRECKGAEGRFLEKEYYLAVGELDLLMSH